MYNKFSCDIEKEMLKLLEDQIRTQMDINILDKMTNGMYSKEVFLKQFKSSAYNCILKDMYNVNKLH